MMIHSVLLASSLIVLAMAASAQSIPEKTGVNSALGIAPKTASAATSPVAPSPAIDSHMPGRPWVTSKSLRTRRLAALRMDNLVSKWMRSFSS